MKIVLCDINLIEARITKEHIQKAIDTDRVQQLLREKCWWIDKYSNWNPNTQWATDFSSVAFRMDKLWIEDTILMGDVHILLDTPCGFIYHFDFPQNIRFIMKGKISPPRVTNKGVKVPESYFMVGFSYLTSDTMSIHFQN